MLVDPEGPSRTDRIRSCPAKIAVCLVALAHLCVLVSQAQQANHKDSDLLGATARLASGILLVLVTTTYLFTFNTHYHRALTYHIFVVSTVAFCDRLIQVIAGLLGPTTPSWKSIDHASLAFLVSLVVMTSIVPLGPPLHQDLSTLYTPAVSKRLSETEEPDKPNVILVTSCSILSLMTYGYVNPIITTACKLTQLDVQDFPAPTSCFKAGNMVLDSMRSDQTTGIGSGSTWGMLYTLWWPERWTLALCTYRPCPGRNHC